jgi:hypothetical protein
MTQKSFICKCLKKSDSEYGRKFHIPATALEHFNVGKDASVVLHFYQDIMHITFPILDFGGKTHRFSILSKNYCTLHFTSEKISIGLYTIDMKNSDEDVIIFKMIKN